MHKRLGSSLLLMSIGMFAFVGCGPKQAAESEILNQETEEMADMVDDDAELSEEGSASAEDEGAPE